MYIPEFICGVIATLLFEVGLSIVWYLSYNKDKRGGDK